MAAQLKKSFANQTVRLDGSSPYSDCVFENCTIVYDGADIELKRPSFRNCKLILEGPAAATIAVLIEMKDHDPDLVGPVIQKLNGSIVEADDHD